MSTKPLAGVRVADFTWVWAGPFCTEQLAHLGAEVIRVETAARQCVTRMLPPFAEFQPGPNRSGYFNQYNQGKLSLARFLRHGVGAFHPYFGEFYLCRHEQQRMHLLLARFQIGVRELPQPVNTA